MSNHAGPENVPRDELRCEALVKGTSAGPYEWMKHDRRCPRRCNQTRHGFAVCHVHAKTDSVEKFQ